MRHIGLAVLLLLTQSFTSAQQLRPLPSSVLYGELLRLRSLTSVLYVAAHPDDENTRLLAWLARGRHIRTGYVSITRGDGGQNIIGGEQGAPLGLYVVTTSGRMAAKIDDIVSDRLPSNRGMKMNFSVGDPVEVRIEKVVEGGKRELVFEARASYLEAYR